MTKLIYIFSGLGADESVFQKIDFSEYSIVFIKWITPVKNETLQHYATRIIAQIKTPEPVLIGLSFGGIVAIEVARQIETAKIILIASAKNRKEIPFYYRIAGNTRLYKILPLKAFKTPNFITYWFFGTSSAFEKQLLKQILAQTDTAFLKWAIAKVICWSNTTHVKNILHIHGTKDRILPVRFVTPSIKIAGGGHFMVLNKAEELSTLLQQHLPEYCE